MKKIISLLISIFLIISSVNVLAIDIEAEYESPEKTGEAISLIKAVTESDYFDSELNKPVSRAEFVTLVGKVLNCSYSQTYQKVFSDVLDGSEYAPYIYWALESGFVSKADVFRPDDTITLHEAVRICVSAIGQDEFAKIKGGFPNGYMSAASEAGLFDGMGNASVMTKDNTAILLSNMLTCELLSVEGAKGDNISYGYQGNSLLYDVHKIKVTEGLITQTKLTSFDKDYSYSKDNDTVTVNGYSYHCDIDINDYFGMNCLVYCKEEGSYETIVSVYPVDNEIIEFNIEDIESFDDEYLEAYDKNGKKRKYKVKASYTEVYNGKVTSPDRTHVTDLTGIVKLLDNNDDNVYDVIYIEHYSYAQVRNVNVADRVIEDKNSTNYNINVDEDTVFFTIADSYGNVLKASDIMPGDVLAVLKSEDGTIARITVLRSPVSSKIESVKSDGTIVIAGNEYKLSDYAKEFCDKRFRTGEEIEFYANSNGELVYAFFMGDKYTYGYLINMYKDEKGEPYVRVFASSEEFKDYEFDDKLMLDGVKDTSEKIYQALESDFEPQFIRYKLNKEGLIVSIDTAEECIIDSSVTLEEWEAEKDENNMLTRYDYGKSSYMFRSNYCFGTSFNAVGATVFMLPVKEGSTSVIDVSNKDDFEMLDITSIQSGFAYSYFDVYDVNEYGTAAVLVARNVKTTGSPYSFRDTSSLKSNAGMVSNVETAINDDDEPGLNVEIWTNGTFKEYFVSEEVECIMKPDTMLEKGDVVRFKTDGNEIKEIILDFDYSTFDGNYKYNNASAQFNKGNTTLTYQVGKLYNNDDNFCLYSNVKTGDKYDFSPVNLSNSQVSTKNICCYDYDRDEVFTITVDELRSSKLYGDESDYVLIKQDGLVTQCIFVYRNGGN